MIHRLILDFESKEAVYDFVQGLLANIGAKKQAAPFVATPKEAIEGPFQLYLIRRKDGSKDDLFLIGNKEGK